MGGRKGYSLKKVVGDVRKVAAGRKDLLQGIKEGNPKKVAHASAKILAKSDKALDSLVHSYLFVGSIKSEHKKLAKEKTKERKKEIAKKWASYRKEQGKKYDSSTNREVVDSAAKILGGKR